MCCLLTDEFVQEEESGARFHEDCPSCLRGIWNSVSHTGCPQTPFARLSLIVRAVGPALVLL